MRHSGRLLVAAVAWVLSSPLAAQQPEFETTEVADGVYQFRFQAHNSLFVVGEAGVLVVDPISPEAAARLAEAIRRHAPGKRLHTVAYSHDHADHASGAPVLFRELNRATIVAQERAKEKIAARDDPDLPPPDVTVPDGGRHVVDLGDRTVELRHLGRSHSDNMLVAYLPRQKLIFAVDFVSHNSVGFRDLPDFHWPDLLEAMRRLQELDYETIVFGNGPPGDRSSVERQIRYYTDLRDAVAGAVEEGLSEDEAAARVRLPEYSDWRGYDGWFELNVRKMYRWLSDS